MSLYQRVVSSVGCTAGFVLAVGSALLVSDPSPGLPAQTVPSYAASVPVSQAELPLAGILRRYKVRPPWPVAGVDYATGADAASTLVNPTTLARDGVAVDVGRHLVTVSGNKVMLRGVDFGLDGGWGVRVTGHDITILNSRFQVGRNNILPLAGSPAASDLRIIRCTIDGAGQGKTGAPAQIWSLIAFEGLNLTIGWSWLLNAPQHYVEFRHGRLIVYNNIFERAGFYPGAHVNTIQFSGSDASNSLFLNNTLFDPQPDGRFPSPGEGVQVEAQLGGTVSDTTIAFNTLIATGPALTASYLVVIRQDPGRNMVDGVTVKSNYFDVSGAYGPFYPYSGGSRLSFTGNRDMVSGKLFAGPKVSTKFERERLPEARHGSQSSDAP